MSPAHRRALTLSIGLAALLYLGFVLFADREAVFAALRRVGLPVLLAIFALSLLNYLLRFWRWQHYVAAFDWLCLVGRSGTERVRHARSCRATRCFCPTYFLAPQEPSKNLNF